MKKVVTFGCILILAAMSAATAQDDGPRMGVGAFAGLSFPIAQDDQSQGMEFGFKGRYGLGSIVVIEPYVAFTSWGEPDPVDDIDLGIDGSKVTAFGLEATLGNFPGISGISPFVFVGAGSFKVKNDDTGYESSKIGMTGGLGMGFGLSPSLSVDVRARALVAPQEEGGSKKAVGGTVGLNFSFGGK